MARDLGNERKGWAALTPAQRQVAELVGEGLTNPEIGARLGIEATTVKAHLRQVFAKLELPGRTALARYLWQRRRDAVLVPLEPS